MLIQRNKYRPILVNWRNPIDAEKNLKSNGIKSLHRRNWVTVVVS